MPDMGHGTALECLLSGYATNLRRRTSRPGPRRRELRVMGQPDRTSYVGTIDRKLSRGIGGGEREIRRGRVRCHRPGHSPRSARLRGGRRVHLSRRFHRSRCGEPSHRGDTACHGRTPSRARGAHLWRDAHAGGHRRLRPDDQDRGRGRRAQGRRASLPRLPSPPHDRRRVRLMGLPWARHRRRTEGSRRISRPSRIRNALRRAFSRWRPGVGEPREQGSHRRGRGKSARSRPCPPHPARVVHGPAHRR